MWSRKDGTYTIRCPDSDPITVRNGNDGDTGQQGETGEQGEAGEDGDDCRITDNEDGTLTIHCGDEEPVTVRLPRCGDGVVSGGEECDDGNLSNEDACTILCRSARCGDGATRRDLAESRRATRNVTMPMTSKRMPARQTARAACGDGLLC